MERNKEMFRYAYTQSPFYQAVLDKNHLKIGDLMEDWSKIPVVTKRQMVCGEESVLPYSSCDFFGESEMMYKLAADEEGVCLNVAWTQRDLVSSLSPLWDCRGRFYGIRKQDRCCSFRMYPDKNDKDLTLNRDFFGNDLGFSVLHLTRERLEGIYRVMLQYRPKWLSIQPSVAGIFADYILEKGVQPISSLICVELFGEKVSEEARSHIEEAFRCRTVFVYDCDEMNAIAYECPDGHLHVLEENVMVEIMDGDRVVPDGEEGDIVLTCLSNTVMPFVRYRTGDRGKIVSEQCNCGNAGKILDLVQNQNNEMIQLEHDINIPPYEFTYAFQRVAGMKDIELMQYQVEQTGCHTYIVTIVAKSDKIPLSEKEEQEKISQMFISNIVYDYIQESTFTFRFQEELLPKNTDDSDRSRIFWSFIDDEED